MEAAASPPLPYSREKLLILGSREGDSTYPFVRRVQMSQTAGVLPLSLVFSDRGAGVAVATLAPIEFGGRVLRRLGYPGFGRGSATAAARLPRRVD
jgi:hypothetical protein